MASGRSIPLIACSLDTGGKQQRLLEWRQLLAEAAFREEIPDGLRYFFPAGEAMGGRVRALAGAEKQCCSFLDFMVEEQAGVVVMTVVAPPEGREALRFLFAAATD